MCAKRCLSLRGWLVTAAEGKRRITCVYAAGLQLIAEERRWCVGVLQKPVVHQGVATNVCQK